MFCVAEEEEEEEEDEDSNNFCVISLSVIIYALRRLLL